MDKATEIADAIWRLNKEYDEFPVLGRCIDGLNIAYKGQFRPNACELQWLWSKKIRETCEKFKQEQLSDAIGYLVLLHSVSEFLEKEGEL